MIHCSLVNIPADTVKSRYKGLYEWQRAFQHKINYPKAACDLNYQDTVYMSFEITNKGQLQNVKLVHCKYPAFALEVARVLVTLPHIKPEYDVMDTVKRPVQFILPVNFVLK
jgi:hypothetical protein